VAYPSWVVKTMVDGLAGHAFIVGSMERHEFRFAVIAVIFDWIRQHIKPF